jgi:hypothetical protein
MNIQVVVAGPVGARILGRVLRDSGADWAMIREAEDRSDAIIYASTLLSAAYDLTTVLVLDADTLEDAPLQEQRSRVEHLVRPSSVGMRFRLVLSIPQVEAVLFSDRAGLERALGRKIADDDFFEARFRPKTVFERVVGNDDTEAKALAVIDALDEAALARMARHPIIREIVEFAEEVRRTDEETVAVPVRRAG